MPTDSDPVFAMHRQEPQSRTPMEVTPAQGPTYVVIRDFDVPFWAMVRFLVQVSVAAVPAAIILALLWVFVVGGIIGAIIHH